MLYTAKIKEANIIHEKYWSLLPSISKKLDRNLNKHNPNLRVIYVAQNFLYAGGSLSNQIMKALSRGDILISIIALRTLFEMSVNVVYVFNHPSLGRNQPHIRRCCKEIIKLSNKKRNVNHTRINSRTFKERLKEVNMSYLYSHHYRIMSDWAHLMTHAIPIATKKGVAAKFGLGISANCLYSLHNIYDSVCAYCQYNLNPELQKLVVEYKESIEKGLST